MTDGDWEELRREGPDLRCYGCGGRMHTRARDLTDPQPDEPTELRIFAHNPGEGEKCKRLGWDGSPDHDRLKGRLASAARRAGWSVELEVQPSEDCRSDVVATHPTSGKSHALEAQLATLNMHHALERHERYEREFGRCTWTHTGRREWASQVPSLRVDASDHGTVVGGILVDLRENVEADPSPLSDVIPEILENRMLYVYDGDWGTFVLRQAMSSGGGELPKRRRPRITGEGAARFCRKMTDLGEGGRALLESGIADSGEFRRLLDDAHLAVRTLDSRLVTKRQWLILAMAGEHPSLKDIQPEVDAALRTLRVSMN